MCKPLTGVASGATTCLFLASDGVLGGGVPVDVIGRGGSGGAREYAGGGPSSGLGPVEGYISQRLEGQCSLLGNDG